MSHRCLNNVAVATVDAHEVHGPGARYSGQSASKPWHTVPSQPSLVQWQTAQNTSPSTVAWTCEVVVSDMDFPFLGASPARESLLGSAMP
jgi:hypothetical protein